MKYFNWSSRKI